jgi:hypothetical protein
MKMLVLALSFISLNAAASPKEDLTALIRCHHGIEERSFGESQKLVTDGEASTPIAIFSAKSKKLFFFTDQTVSYLDTPAIAGKDIVVKLQNQQKLFYAQLNLTAEGKIGGMPPEVKNTQGALEPKAVLTSESLDILRGELVHRWSDLSYPCDENHQVGHFKDAVTDCMAIDNKKLQAAVAKKAHTCDPKTKGKKGASTHSAS